MLPQPQPPRPLANTGTHVTPMQLDSVSTAKTNNTSPAPPSPPASSPPCRGGKDPRFDSTIGGKPFNQDEFARRYKFLYDDVLPQERADLKKQLRVSWCVSG